MRQSGQAVRGIQGQRPVLQAADRRPGASRNQIAALLPRDPAHREALRHPGERAAGAAGPLPAQQGLLPALRVRGRPGEQRHLYQLQRQLRFRRGLRGRGAHGRRCVPLAGERDGPLPGCKPEAHGGRARLAVAVGAVQFAPFQETQSVIVTSGISMQYGAKPLFENVSVKFGGGNRYGLIGANGSGKSTFMKILGGDLEPSTGSVAIDSGERLGKLRQDQFAFENERVLDVVMQGHTAMWNAMRERDAIYANPDADEAEFLRAADLEAKYAEYGGYTAEAKAGELLLGLGVPTAQHNGPMSAVAPGWKLRVLLAQALFGDPEILLLDEPTNNLDINSIRWLEDVLNQRNSTMVIISHDRHFLSAVCTHMADVDYGNIKVYPGSYDDYMEAVTLARQQQLNK